MSAPIPATGGGCTGRSTSSTTSPPISTDPTGYLAGHPLPILDDLLKNNRPRKEWTFDDLAATVEGLNGGRSFANGKQIFEVASCVSCHRMNGVGVQVGPDLAQLDAKMTRAEILRSLIEPSAKIDEKYQTHVFAMKSGKVVTGMILEEDPRRIKVIENPLAKSAPVSLDRNEIDERSPVSDLDHAQGPARQADP